MNPKLSKERGDGARGLTTRWSVIFSCADSQGEPGKAREALAELCRIYWRPVFAYICRSGRSTMDAQDLTQDFFLMVLQGNFLKLADPERGRFRSLLFKAVQHFLISAHEKQHAKKRGGHLEFVSWEDWMAEAPSHLCIPVKSAELWPAEKLFDYRWAATVVERALRRLGEECEAAGRRRVFDAVNSYLLADRHDISYPELAQRLAAPIESVKRLMHCLRARYRELLREEVGHTVANAADVDEELHYLCVALASAE